MFPRQTLCLRNVANLLNTREEERRKRRTYWFNGEKAIKILIKRQCSLETNTVNAVFSVFTISNHIVSLFFGGEDVLSWKRGQLYRPWTWHTPDKWLDPSKTRALYSVFMITRGCQGLFMYTLITSSQWPQCQLHPPCDDACQSTLWGQKSHTQVYKKRAARSPTDVIYTKV